VIHHHPANVAVFLTDGQTRFTMPDGKTQDVPVKAESVQWSEAGKRLPKNLGDQPFELILSRVEDQGDTSQVKVAQLRLCESTSCTDSIDQTGRLVCCLQQNGTPAPGQGFCHELICVTRPSPLRSWEFGPNGVQMPYDSRRSSLFFMDGGLEIALRGHSRGIANREKHSQK
jgi:hypothetical protein